MTPDTLSLFAGGLLSLVLSYVPGVSGWFGKQEGTVKRGLVAVLILVIAAAIYGLACGGANLGLGVVCTDAGLIDLARSVVLALVASQSVYSLTPKASQ